MLQAASRLSRLVWMVRGPESMALSAVEFYHKKAVGTKQRGGARLLGEHPDDGRRIRLKNGRFGPYLQWGEDGEDGTTTHSIPLKRAAVLRLTLEKAIGYVGLPRTVCIVDELPIIAAIGPYGPYLKYSNTFLSLYPNDGDVLTIDADTAERLVKDELAHGKWSRVLIAELGEKDGSVVAVKKSRSGMYINWKQVNAKLPPKYQDNPNELPLEDAWTLIKEKITAKLPLPMEKAWTLIQEMASTATSRSPQKKKPTKTKIVGAPKRPLSSYLHFCAAKRPEVTERVKTLGEISKELARLWSETTDRTGYEILAANDKERYELEKNDWLAGRKNGGSETTTADGLSSSSESTKNHTKPKAPSAYMLFCKEIRPTLTAANGEKLPFGEAAKQLGALWKECDDETRQKFQQLAEQEKEILVHAVVG